MDPDRTSKLINGILAQAESSGAGSLTLTAITKFVYLADVYHARQDADRAPFTCIDWRFHHFGAYSYSLSEAIKETTLKNITVASRESQNGDQEYFLISRIDKTDSDAMDKTGLGIRVKAPLVNDIRKFSSDLKGLLYHVYYETEPMAGAKPGSKLSFENCIPRPISDFKSIAGTGLSKKQREHASELVKQLRAKKHKGAVNWQKYTKPVIDEHYLEATALEEDHPPGEKERTSRHKTKLSFGD